MHTTQEAPDKPWQGNMEALCFLLGESFSDVVLYLLESWVVIAQISITDRGKRAFVMTRKGNAIGADSKGAVRIHPGVSWGRFNISNGVEGITDLCPVPMGVSVLTLQPADQVAEVHVKSE